jgi:phage gpG-like protein
MTALKFSGDFKALERFALKLATAGSDSTLRIVNEQLAEEAVDLIRDGFQRSTDPYGKPWKQPVLRSGQPLRDKGGLANSFHRTHADADSFGVASTKDYAEHHQKGTGIYGKHKARIVPKKAKALRVPGAGFFASVRGAPKRLMVPEKRRKLPTTWRIKFVETAQETLTELFKGT